MSDAISPRLTAIRQQHQRRKDIATAANWSADDEIKDILLAALTAAEQARDEAQRALRQVEEREAACCPEDVGFEEFIAALKRSMRALNASVAQRTEERDSAMRELKMEKLVEARLRTSWAEDTDYWIAKHKAEVAAHAETRRQLKDTLDYFGDDDVD